VFRVMSFLRALRDDLHVAMETTVPGRAVRAAPRTSSEEVSVLDRRGRGVEAPHVFAVGPAAGAGVVLDAQPRERDSGRSRSWYPHRAMKRSAMKRSIRSVGTSLVALLAVVGALLWWQARSRLSDASWFQVQAVAPGVWRIDDHGGDNIYLVTGDTRALLIDTGLGIADLVACVRKLTALPVTVVNTHGHLDHAGGDSQFAAVGAHPDDFELILQSGGRENGPRRRGRLLRGLLGLGSPPAASEGAIDRARLVPVRGGHVFDLGGLRIEVLETPSHTKGSLCLLDAAHELLFSGDNNNTVVWLFLQESLPVAAYLRTLERLRARAGEFATILPGHGDPVDAAFLGEQIASTESILNGACTGEPYRNPFGIAALSCSFKRASIAFDPSKLR
jgi:hydroxyacylglutathione hydrolase